VQNSVGASQGDVVAIYREDNVLLTGVASLYIIPILWLMIGAIIGAGLGSGWEIGEAGGAVLIGLSGFVVGFTIIFMIAKSLKSDSDIRPRIIRTIEPPVEGGEAYTFGGQSIATG
jgi:sigma-E factor negative regulatory protein RseC